MIPKQAQKLIIEKANKCWLCDDAVCSKVCKNGYNPEKMLQSLQFANINSTINETKSMTEFENCNCKSYEKTCLRHKTDSSIEICNIITYFKSNKDKCVGCYSCTLICPVCAIDYGARETIKQRKDFLYENTW